MAAKVSIEIDDQRSIDVYESFVDVWVIRNGRARFERIGFDEAFASLEARFKREFGKDKEKETLIDV